VELAVPDTTWSVAIDKVYRVGDELWVISHVSRDPDMMGAQVISTVRASLEIAAPDLPVQNFITGKTWTWENSEGHTFIEDLKQIDAELQTGRRLYPSPRPCP
jgi:hypothetical protein